MDGPLAVIRRFPYRILGLMLTFALAKHIGAQQARVEYAAFRQNKCSPVRHSPHHSQLPLHFKLFVQYLLHHLFAIVLLIEKYCFSISMSLVTSMKG